MNYRRYETRTSRQTLRRILFAAKAASDHYLPFVQHKEVEAPVQTRVCNETLIKTADHNKLVKAKQSHDSDETTSK